jgi:hypothetical protein
MAYVKKFIYNAIDDENSANYLMSYIYQLLCKRYPDIIVVLNGNNNTIHQFLTLIGGIYYNSNLKSLLPADHQIDEVDKLNGLFADDFIKYEGASYKQSYNKICVIDYRNNEHRIKYRYAHTMKNASGIIILTNNLPIISEHDTCTYNNLRIINFTNIKDEFNLQFLTRDLVLKHTLELKELCTHNKNIEIDHFSTTFRNLNTKCLVHTNISDNSLLSILMETLRPSDNEYFGICVPAHPKSMAKLLINGTPIVTKKLPPNIDLMKVKNQKINKVKYTFSGWLDYETKTDNMYDDIKWKCLETIDINIDDLLESVEIFDGFILSYFDSFDGDLYIISPIEFNINTVKKTYELFSQLRKEGRLTDQSKVDLFYHK